MAITGCNNNQSARPNEVTQSRRKLVGTYDLPALASIRLKEAEERARLREEERHAAYQRLRQAAIDGRHKFPRTLDHTSHELSDLEVDEPSDLEADEPECMDVDDSDLEDEEVERRCREAGWDMGTEEEEETDTENWLNVQLEGPFVAEELENGNTAITFEDDHDSQIEIEGDMDDMGRIWFNFRNHGLHAQELILEQIEGYNAEPLGMDGVLYTPENLDTPTTRDEQKPKRENGNGKATDSEENGDAKRRRISNAVDNLSPEQIAKAAKFYRNTMVDWWGSLGADWVHLSPEEIMNRISKTDETSVANAAEQRRAQLDAAAAPKKRGRGRPAGDKPKKVYCPHCTWLKTRPSMTGSKAKNGNARHKCSWCRILNELEKKAGYDLSAQELHALQIEEWIFICVVLVGAIAKDKSENKAQEAARREAALQEAIRRVAPGNLD